MWMFGSRTTVKKVRNSLTWFSQKEDESGTSRNEGPVAENESHRVDEINLFEKFPSSAGVQFMSRQHEPHPTLDFLPCPLQLWASQTCVLCGCGDNSVQHWLYFCPVPALAGSLLLRAPWKISNWFLQKRFPPRLAVIAGLWVSARQFIHERSGLPPPSLDGGNMRPFQYSTVLLRFSIMILPRRRELAPSLPIPLRFANYFISKTSTPTP